MLFIAFQAATAVTTCTDAAYSIFIPYINISTELTAQRYRECI